MVQPTMSFLLNEDDLCPADHCAVLLRLHTGACLHKHFKSQLTWWGAGGMVGGGEVAEAAGSRSCRVLETTRGFRGFIINEREGLSAEG